MNPYADRSVMFSLLRVVDEFCVRTVTAGITPCLVIDFDPISSASKACGTVDQVRRLLRLDSSPVPPDSPAWTTP